MLTRPTSAVVALLVWVSFSVGCGQPQREPASPVSSTPAAESVEAESLVDELDDASLRALSMDDLLARLDTPSAYSRILATRELRRRFRERAPDPAWLPRLIERLGAWRYEPTGRSRFRPEDVFAPFGPAAVRPLGDAACDVRRTEAEREVARDVLHLLVHRTALKSAVLDLARDLARSPDTDRFALELLVRGARHAPAPLREAIAEGCFDADDFETALPRQLGPGTREARWLLPVARDLFERGDRRAAAMCVRACGVLAPEHADIVHVAATSQDIETRRTAASAVASLGAAALPIVRNLLRSDDRVLLQHLALGLAGLGDDAAPVWPDVLAAVERGSPLGRQATLWFAAREQGQLEALRRVAEPRMAAWLGSSDKDTLADALNLLQFGFGDTHSNGKHLVRLLAHEDRFVRTRARSELTKLDDLALVHDDLVALLGTASAERIDEIAALVRDDDVLRARTSGVFVRRLDEPGGGAPSVDVLRLLLAEGALQVSDVLARADVEPSWHTAVATTVEAVKVELDPEHVMRLRAWAGLDGDTTIERDDAEHARLLDSTTTLGLIRRDDIPRLIRWLAADAHDVRRAAIRALTEVAPGTDAARRVVAELIALFVRGTSEDALAVARALPSFGEVAHPALPLVARVATDIAGLSGALACFGETGFAAVRERLVEDDDDPTGIRAADLRRDVRFAFNARWFDVDAHEPEVSAFCRLLLIEEFGVAPAGSELPAAVPEDELERVRWELERIQGRAK